MIRFSFVTCLVFFLALPVLYGEKAKPMNLAPLAKITASQRNGSGPYGAYKVADGVFPEVGQWNDGHGAWVTEIPEQWHQAWIEFAWDQPQRIAELHYYCRLGFLAQSNFGEYDLYVDEGHEPVLSGSLTVAYGPQVLRLPTPVTASKIRVDLKIIWHGYQPGINEIEIYPEPVPEDLLDKCIELPLTGFISIPIQFDEEPYRSILRSDASIQLAQELYDGQLGFESLVVVERHHLLPSHVYTYHCEGFEPGGGLYLFRPGEDGGSFQKIVDSPEGQILDVDVSYDGTQILFSWKKTAAHKYQIYRIDADGSNLVQLTNDDHFNYNPCWLPDGGIAFLSTHKPAFAYCYISPVAILYRMDADGSNMVQLSANYLNDFTPTVLDNGRIIYSRWEYVDRPAIPIQSLWTINPDGTGLAGFYGNRVLSPATLMEPRQIPGTQKVLCLLTAHNGPCRGGVGVVDISYGDNTQAALRNVTPDVRMDPVDKGHGNDVAGYWENPYPLTDELFICSYKGQIVLRDIADERVVLLTEARGFDELGWFNPQPLRPRRKPNVIPSMLPPEEQVEGPWAKVYLQDVYQGLEPHVRRGEVKQIAVVQEIEKSRFAHAQYRTFGFQFPTVSCGATYAPKKIWGYADVEPDGSAAFEVPADVPIYFMALDEHGQALQRMRTFTHLKPGERQSCIGCHEPRDQTSKQYTMPTAFQRDPHELKEPEWGVRGFSYSRLVQPVLDQHCIGCHAPPHPAGDVDLTGDKTDFFNVSYEYLARKGTVGEDWEMGGCAPDRVRQYNPYTKWIYTYNGAEANILEITPRFWGSPASRLAELVLTGHPDAEGNKRIEMDENSQRRIFAWIDLNVPYYGTSSSNHYERTGCRRIVPENLEEILADVAKRRCSDCHAMTADGKAGFPRKFYTRITHVERNAFLMAPLAVEAGGSGKCGTAVFESKNDPGYQRILHAFDVTTELLAEQPRMDMEGGPQLHERQTGAKVSRKLQ